MTPEKAEPSSSPPPCVVCGRDDGGKAFESAEPGFSIVACAGCGAARTWPVVPDGEIGRYYPQTYYGSENVRFNPVFEAMTRWFQGRRARVLQARVPKGGVVLDVGCGRGFLLKRLRELGYEPHGVELSDSAAWHARHRLTLQVSTGDFLRGPHRPEHYDAVVFWHTLEHFARPVETLARARELMKPGALIAIAVPNFDSLQARWFGRHWFHLDVPRHYFHFGLRSLEALLAAKGFRVVKSDHFCFEQNPYGWLQSFYNALAFDHNFLYSLLKTRSARTISIRRHPFQAIAVLLLLPPLLLLSVALTLVEAVLRRGGTIELYAAKE